MEFELEESSVDNGIHKTQTHELKRSGHFKSLDYIINSHLLIRHYIDFENFPEFVNRWVLLKSQSEIGKEELFISEMVSEMLFLLVSHIEEVFGFYDEAQKSVSIKKTLELKENLEDDLKLKELYGEHEIEWYIFRTKSGTPYLCTNRDSGEESIYELDSFRRWKPIHNAEAFDGYKGAEKIFRSVLFSFDGKKIKIS